jgi:hypothetical protein
MTLPNQTIRPTKPPCFAALTVRSCSDGLTSSPRSDASAEDHLQEVGQFLWRIGVIRDGHLAGFFGQLGRNSPPVFRHVGDPDDPLAASCPDDLRDLVTTSCLSSSPRFAVGHLLAVQAS